EYKITPCSVGQILMPCLKNVRDLALRTTLTEDDLHGDLIPFLKDSSFIYCMSENLFLIEHLCGPSMAPNDILAISQFASQQQNMARLYDHLRSKARDSILGVTVN
ncbi:hypothetical protein, partial [Aeromonas hydrophila]